MNKPITKAVFPVAGLGSRFLPATKAQPKEMLPIVDKPLIQYAVEEAVAAGITELIFVTGRSKRAIEDHFDVAYELEDTLRLAGKDELLALVTDIIPSHVKCIFTRQSRPLGLGHAVLCAKEIVGDEPFAVILADDFMTTNHGETPVLKQMVDLYENMGNSLIAVQEVPKADTKSYGIVATNNHSQDGEQLMLPFPGMLVPIRKIVEKPDPKVAPSNLAVVGRYVFNPQIFKYLESVQPGAGGEIQLTDAIADMLKLCQVDAYNFMGKRYDCGSKLGYLMATVMMGMEHPEIGQEFVNFLEDM
jgi:UTP--glucose-1-phosphate uridylyltransferase